MSQISKPSSIYPLALAGIIFQVLGLAAFGFGMFPFGLGMMGGYGGMMAGYYNFTSFFAWWLAVGLAIVGLAIYGLKLVSSNRLQSVHSGSLMLLIAAIIAFPTMWL